jgi:hypothetical protein
MVASSITAPAYSFTSMAILAARGVDRPGTWCLLSAVSRRIRRLAPEATMPISLNHTIVYSRDKQEGAQFLTDLFGLPTASSLGPGFTPT